MIEIAIETIRAAAAPYYLYIKFIHMFFVMIWGWSTAVAYTWFVRRAFISWEVEPDNPAIIQRRNWAIEQFDKGAVLEHIAFPIVLLSGILLYVAGPWNMDFQWLMIKLTIVAFIFLPMEVIDYWFAHFGGNKEKLRLQNDKLGYEAAIENHWLFLKIVTPVVIVFMPLVLFLAIVKPV